jgi:hypothetical protein
MLPNPATVPALLTSLSSGSGLPQGSHDLSVGSNGSISMSGLDGADGHVPHLICKSNLPMVALLHFVLSLGYVASRFCVSPLSHANNAA